MESAVRGGTRPAMLLSNGHIQSADVNSGAATMQTVMKASTSEAASSVELRGAPVSKALPEIGHVSSRNHFPLDCFET